MASLALNPKDRPGAQALREVCAREAEEAVERRSVARKFSNVADPLSLPGEPGSAAPVAGAIDRRPAAWSREPCLRCGIRGDFGCEHQRPYEPRTIDDALREGAARDTHNLYRETSPIGATGLEAETLAFIARVGLSRSAFCDAIGQSANWRDGFFTKAREGRLRPATVEKVWAFMNSYGAADA